jgi:hypothetical protein
MFTPETQAQINNNLHAAAYGGAIFLTAAAYREILMAAEAWQAAISSGGRSATWEQPPTILFGGEVQPKTTISITPVKYIITSGIGNFYKDIRDGAFLFTVKENDAARYTDIMAAECKRLQLGRLFPSQEFKIKAIKG